MNLLIDLPVDIWSILCLYLTGEELLNLTELGSEQVTKKLLEAAIEFHFTQLDPLPDFERLLSFKKIKLISIKISGVYKNLISTAEYGLSDAVLKRLPETLRVLRLGTFRAPDASLISKLPRQLIELELDLESSKSQTIAQIPPSLTSFVCNGKLPQYEAAYLPKTLTKLSLQHVAWNDNVVSLLPNNLTFLELTFSRFTDVAVPLFPKSLTYLDIAFSEISSASLPYLSPNLTFLNIRNADITPDDLNLLPRSLKAAIFPAGFEFLLCDQHIKLLPRGQEYLPCHSNQKLTVASIDDWPVKMYSDGSDFPTRLRPHFIPRILSGFKHDTLDSRSWIQAYIDNDHCKHIPETVKTIAISNQHSSLDDRAIPDLPRSLTVLRFPFGYSALSDRCIPDLPRSLRVLSIPSCTKITDRQLEHLPATLELLDISHLSELTDDGFIKLSSLTNLKTLYATKSSKITDKAIEALPKSIEILDIAWASEITDEGIKYLPPNLKKLILITAKLLTNSCILHLPRTLTEVNFSKAHKITDFEKFPAGAKVLIPSTLPFGKRVPKHM